MNIETDEYKGYIAYYIFGEYCGDRKYTLKIMKLLKVEFKPLNHTELKEQF